MLFLLTYSAQKIGKDSWYFNNSLLRKREYSLTTKTFLLLKTQNTSTLEQVAGRKTLNLVFQKMLDLFLKIQENFRISTLKKSLHNLYVNENFKLEIKPMIENLQDELQKTNKQKVINFLLTLDGSWKAKKASKLSSKYLMDRICNNKQYLNYIN